MLDIITSFDENVLLWIQENVRNSFLSSVLIPITKSGDVGIIFIVLGIIFLCFKRTRKTGIIFLMALVLNFIVNNLIIKNVIARERPFNVIENLIILIPPPGGYSFPSGHTSSAFACMITLFFTEKRFAPVGLVYALLMGFSRMYAGVHYPTDVICGAVVGTVIACFSAIGYNYFMKRLNTIKK